MAAVDLVVVVSNKVLVEFKAQPSTRKITLLECKFHNFTKYHSLPVVAPWVAAVDLAKVVVAADLAKAEAVDLAKVVVVVGLVRVVVAVDLAKAEADLVRVVVDLVRAAEVDSAKAVAVADSAKVAAAVDLARVVVVEVLAAKLSV